MKMHEKTAELSMELRAESGYEATAYYKVSAQQWGDALRVCEGSLSSDTLRERDLLRAALAQLVGASSRAELEGLRSALSAVPASSADRAAMDAALDALLITLPEGA